jgi:hypothetical protein
LHFIGSSFANKACLPAALAPPFSQFIQLLEELVIVTGEIETGFTLHASLEFGGYPLD